MSDEPTAGPDRNSAAGNSPAENAVTQDFDAQTVIPKPSESLGADTHRPSVNDGTSVTGMTATPIASGELTVGVGTELGYYRLVKKLGEGGMGAVWLALHTKLDKQVAVKVLPATWNRDPALLSRFEREMKAVGKLEHPHIVRAMDAGEFQGTHYLVMEFNEGQDLSLWVKQRGPQSISNACEMLRHAALGLAHAHESGLIHRDIKPSNLFLTKQGKVKILDLGLARVQGDNAGGGQTLTGFGQVLGTPDYMAPEQWENTHGADGRSDLYALGCTLFYLLTGRAPFSEAKHSSLVGKMKGHTLDPIPDLKAARQAAVADRPKLANDLVSEELDSLYRKLMAKKPEDRFSSGLELAEALTVFGKSKAGASGVLVKGSSPVAPRQEIRPSTHAEHATDSQPETIASRLGQHVSEQLGDNTTATQTATKFEPGAPADSTTVNDELSFLTMFAGASSSTTQHDAAASGLPGHNVSASDRTSPPLDHSLARRAKTSGRKLGMILGGLVAFIVLGAIFIKLTKKNGAALEVAGSDGKVTVEITNEEEVAPAPKKKRNRQSATKPEVSPSDSSVEPATTTPVAPNPPPTTPEPAPTTPAVTSPKPTTPESTTAPSESGRTLIVGVAKDEISDFGAALAQAKPGDTILIRHRGPLEFAPVDLTGKTPLTIAGDVKSGVDYWPILRQATGKPNDQERTSETVPSIADTPGLFYAKQLDVTFRKLHLVAAGPKRANLGSVFGCERGRVELDQCTLTVGVQGNPGELPGAPVSLVRMYPEANGAIELVLNQSFFRGLRLQSCVSAEHANQIDVKGLQTVWAGGPSPWIVARDTQGTVKLALSNCTIYNVPSFLSWESHDATASTKSTIDAQVEKCVFVGPYANKEPFVAWSPGVPKSDLTSAATDGSFRWRGTNNVFHRYGGFFIGPDPRKQPGLDEWRKLWSQSGPGMDRQTDPIFRVWPDGYELQESLARDFQPRVSRNKARNQNIEADTGANHDQIPNAFVDVVNRPLSPPEVAAKPRGVPRVLRIHQKEGPHKTLEGAFAAAKDGDIIEIASDGPFTPARDFGQPKDALASAETAVIPVTVSELSLRASDDARPVVILDERKQRSLGRRSLVLFYVASAQAFSVEGIHFHLIQPKESRAGIAFEIENRFCRWTNCSFTQANDGGQAIYNWVTVKPRFQALFRTSVVWLENNSYNANFSDGANLGAQGPGYLSIRNCLSVGPFLSLSTYAEANTESDLVLSDCSVFGQALFLNVYDPKLAIRARCQRNLVVQTGGGTFVSLEPSASLSRVNYDGLDNCISWSDRIVPAAERDRGLNAMLPGSKLSSIPLPEGSPLAKDLYRPFRLKKGQPAAKMAPDGGPVGVRFEYLPELPPQLSAILQSK